MKTLKVTTLPDPLSEQVAWDELTRLVQNLEYHRIDQVNWPVGYPYCPDVRFQIARAANGFLLHYLVEEQQLLAANSFTNQHIWEDSCVEFFVSFDQAAHYYNIEINLIGSALIGYGSKEKSKRQRLPDETIEQIQTFTLIHRKGNKHQWELFAILPFSVFPFSDLSNLDAKEMRANFYKCGDKLDQPHFVSWNKVDAPAPNFHLPEFFGILELQ